MGKMASETINRFDNDDLNIFRIIWDVEIGKDLID